ncbi:sulfatase-like hydrolase/transferase [Portibacter lacus]|uniref:Choline-sulfatase n=1 Tax=Portibacter lacus TaxID=1099794 RepID=A0AA37SPC0_9BACT|nr:sulfatase-like hydrolase/transferase [Portibacter lacus]GLR16749.1 choline-sulfatase [Portibacter lacus]
MKRIPIYFLLIALLTVSCKSDEKKTTEDGKPNIVFLFADDMTYTAIHALGNEEIHTPNLDRLVQNGTSFTHTYNMGGWNGAICAASRAMMISGRHLWRANEYKKNWGKDDTVAIHNTWGKLMEKGGYDTYMTGKWHVGAPADKVFQHSKHIRPGMPKDAWGKAQVGRKFNEVVGKQKIDGRLVTADDIMPVGYNRPKSEDDDSWDPADPKFGGFWEGGKHWSEVLKDDALEYIDMAKDKDNPFFMYLAFNAPHDPRQAPQEYLDMYSLDNISVPASFLPEYPDKELMGNGRGLRDEALAPYPRTEYAVKVNIKEYYAIITHLDAQIGEILDALEASGKMDNTYIFFSADHGLAVGKHGLIGKQSMYDHSVRPPMMVMGPGIPKGERIDSDVYLQDIMATSLDIAGIEKPDYVEFKSFLPQAKGISKEKNYDEIYGAYINVQRMIRKDGYKLIVYPKSETVLLFDLTEDPEEITNIAANDDQHDRVKSMFEDLMKLQVEMDDKLSLQEIYNQI